MKTNLLTSRGLRIYLSILLGSFLSIYSNLDVNAQCSLACNGTTQISLDSDCTAEVTPAMILNDDASSCPTGSFIVEIQDHYGNVIPFIAGPNGFPLIDGSLIGEDVIASVIDVVSGNSCWGDIIVEDKKGPSTTSCNTPQNFSCAEFAEYEGPVYTDCEGEVEPILISEAITPLNCDDDFVKTITRVYTAFDQYGNEADHCTIIYQLERIDTNLITCPKSFTVFDDNALSCDGDWTDLACASQWELDTDTDADNVLDADLNWDDNGNGYPDPQEVGVPTYNGVDLWPLDPSYYCNIGVFYEDLELPQIGCVKKIMRRWEVREWWCGQEIVKVCIQILEIADNEAPTFTCPNTELCVGYHSISTNVHGYSMNSPFGTVDCAAEYYPTIPTITDNCGTTFRVDYTWADGTIQNYDGTQAILLPLGQNEITITVYDECYNSTECTYIIEVVDNTPPVTICDEFTVASLTTNGEAKIFATTFDDGSHDDCKLKKMLVRRMLPENEDEFNCDCHQPYYEDMDFLGELDGRLYYASQGNTTWLSALKMAKSMGGYLLQVDNAAEHAFVANAVNGAYPYYFDYSDQNCDNNYELHNGFNTSYANWATGYPNNALPGRFGQVNISGDWINVSGETLMGRYIMEVEDPCTFSHAAIFCCDDITSDGSNHMVVFRAIDYYGNYNDCMVNVEVQDKIAPTITCPAPDYVQCDFSYSLDHLSNYFDGPVYHDNCNAVLDSVIVENLNQCNIGYIERTFTATDDYGRSDSCKHYIHFSNDNPFTKDEITWPADLTIYECTNPQSLSPDMTGYPTYDDDQCDLVGANYDSEIFYFNNGEGSACAKILRTWTVIDWCQTTNDGDFVTWDSVQVIKIHNLEDPIIQESCDELVECTYDATCTSGYIELIKTALDSCTLPENLSWSYQVDLNCDGSFDTAQETTVQGNGNSADASGDYPIGSHCIIWSFADRCGNVVTCIQPFSIINCKVPTPYCLSGLAVDLMAIDTNGDGNTDFGMIELWASDFDNGSFHPCGYPVILSFSADTSETNFTFGCEHVEPNVQVEIWVSVALPDTLLQSFCLTEVDIQDNMNACSETSGGAKYMIDGNVSTELEEDLIDVEVELFGADAFEMTSETGNYAFPEMGEGSSYAVIPNKEDIYINGVSTIDIVHIQRHILGVQDLDSPYKMIAADVNHDETISAQDLSDIRKLILGVNEGFGIHKAWRFVDQAYDFIDPTNPLNESFTETYDIPSLNNDMNIDFYGVKLGDVDNSVELNLANAGTDNRSDDNFVFELENKEFTLNEIIEVPFYTKSEAILGLQWTLNVNASSLEILSIESNQIELKEGNLNLADVNNGLVSMSWNATSEFTIDVNQPLFTVVLKAKTTDNLLGKIEFNSSITKAEVYNADFESTNPIIEFIDGNGNVEAYNFALFQNTPNPFDGSTSIEFVVPTESQVSFTITDITGKVLRRINNTYPKGKNILVLEQKSLGTSGVLYYHMESNGFTATKKMIVLK